MDMSGKSNRPVNDWGWCTILTDLTAQIRQPMQLGTTLTCDVTCGGKTGAYTPYVCGSTVPEIGTMYYKRGGKCVLVISE